MSLRKDYVRRRKTLRRHWSPQDAALAMLMHQEGCDEAAIASRLNRSAGAVRARLDVDLYRVRVEAIAASHADPVAMAERDARDDAYRRQDVTGMVLGDPPPGFSALDRRQLPSP